MKFVMDPALIEKARELILHRPNLNVLKPLNEGHYAPLVHALETAFKSRDASGDLLLPDLSALANSTIGIFSDYGGESAGNYYTYSFLVCAWGSLDTFRREMKKVRARFSMADKEIAFKNFGNGPVKRALSAYLEVLNGYVPGLLFTLVVQAAPFGIRPANQRHRPGSSPITGRKRVWNGTACRRRKGIARGGHIGLPDRASRP